MDLHILNEYYDLTPAQIHFYKINNYIKLKHVFNEQILSYFESVVTQRVSELNNQKTPIQDRDTYGKAFLQLMNLWVNDEEIQKLIFSKRLAKIAADLMQIDGVRLYHDQALFKEAGGGITPWHADQYYWPLTNDNTITAWIPLQKTPLEMGPLEFSAGSHAITAGRELSIGDESEMVMTEKLRVTDFPHIIEPFDIGEISFHSGWIFHRAGANATDQIRKVMTIIYMDKNMRLKQPENENQSNDWDTWCQGVKVGSIIDSPLNPILYTEGKMPDLEAN